MSAFPPDSELVSKAIAGDREAFARLCTRHKTRLWRVVASVARSGEVEELAQEALVRAWCALRTYRGEASFAAWLCRIALNVAHDHQKSAWQRRVLLFWQPERGEETGESTENAVVRREMHRRVRRAVAGLPAKQRVPIWLHYFEEFTLAEVARLEQSSESTVRSRIQAGLRRLALSLDDLLVVPEAELPTQEPAKGFE